MKAATTICTSALRFREPSGRLGVRRSGATIRYFREPAAPAAGADAYRTYRCGIGRAILLGLELLVAADIINTVAIERSLAVLAGIVAIRTFLSISLEVEIDGRWPWRKDPKS